MKTFTWKCVTLEEVCKHFELNFEETAEKISNSDISFGSNGDTLIHFCQLDDILGQTLVHPFHETHMISLGS